MGGLSGIGALNSVSSSFQPPGGLLLTAFVFLKSPQMMLLSLVGGPYLENYAFECILCILKPKELLKITIPKCATPISLESLKMIFFNVLDDSRLQIKFVLD